MERRIRTTEVFTPNEFPLYTYVPRDNGFERRVKEGLMTPGLIVSVSGPSKSGKTVLIQRVAGTDNLIRVFGPQITSPGDLWDHVLDWMGTPSMRTEQSASGTSSTTTGGTGVTVGAPGIISVGGNATLSKADVKNETSVSNFARGGMGQVAREIANSDFVVFVDDFHYMPRNLQVEVAKHLKAAAELGIKSCVASVPHRADDVVRANPELRGRVQAIDMEYWRNDELVSIGIEGFRFLAMDMPRAFIDRLAVEACGSPQLMQALCLQTCYRFDVYETLDGAKGYDPTDEDFRKILESTSTLADFSTMVEALHGGPKTHGTDRNSYKFVDGMEGDMYRAVMLAIACDPPVMSIPYSDLVTRVRSICVGAAPSGRNVSDACEQISKLAAKGVKSHGGVQSGPPIEWDKTTDPENMHIIEPYFLFYLRASPKLRTLGKEGNH